MRNPAHQPLRILVASGNRHKVREIAQILGPRFRVLGLDALASAPRVIENGRTFRANARIKALKVRDRALKLRASFDVVIADDSGLAVRALGGRPGIRSARYAGPRADDASNRRKLLEALVGRRDRRAAFECVIAAVRLQPRSIPRFFRGTVKGRIVDGQRGAGGFGYDPVFQPEGFARTFGELSAATKNRLSHRARALQKLKRWLGALRRG